MGLFDPRHGVTGATVTDRAVTLDPSSLLYRVQKPYGTTHLQMSAALAGFVRNPLIDEQ